MAEGEAVLGQAVENAIAATNTAVTDGVCNQHDGLRLGINTLLLCKQDDMKNKKKNGGFYIGPVGPFERRDGYRLCLIALVIYGALVLYGKAPLPGPDILEGVVRSEVVTQ